MLLTFALQAREVVDDSGLCKINWSRGFVTCVGESAEGQSSFAAKLSAKVIAQRNLLEVVKGVRIDSEVTIQDGMITSDVIKSRVEGVVRGGQIIDNRYDDGKKSATATVRLQMGKDLLAALLSDPDKLSWNETIKMWWDRFSLIPEAHAAAAYTPGEQDTIRKVLADLRERGDSEGSAYFENVLKTMSANNHTGILIDISDLPDFRKAMIVRLVDEDGAEIYPASVVSKETLMKRNTSVGYVFGFEDARLDKRVFDRPLELKATSVYKNKKSNIVLTKAQLERLEMLDPVVLKSAKIILVLGE